MYHRSLWKDLAILCNESNNTFSEWGIKTFEKSKNLFLRLDNTFNSEKKIGHVPRSLIVEITLLQSVPKHYTSIAIAFTSLPMTKPQFPSVWKMFFGVDFLLPIVEFLLWIFSMSIHNHWKVCHVSMIHLSNLWDRDLFRRLSLCWYFFMFNVSFKPNMTFLFCVFEIFQWVHVYP